MSADIDEKSTELSKTGSFAGFVGFSSGDPSASENLKYTRQRAAKRDFPADTHRAAGQIKVISFAFEIT